MPVARSLEESTVYANVVVAPGGSGAGSCWVGPFCVALLCFTGSPSSAVSSAAPVVIGALRNDDTATS